MTTRAMHILYAILTLLLYGALPAWSQTTDPTVSQVRHTLMQASLPQLQRCLQQKAGFTKTQTKQLEQAAKQGRWKLAQFRMTGFDVGGYCGEHFLSSRKRAALFKQISQQIQGYFQCLHKRTLLCQQQGTTIRCWRLSIEFLFQAFSDGTPFQSKMPRPFVCRSPAFRFQDKTPPKANCAHAAKIQSWKGDEQHLLGLLRGCTLELFFRRYWQGPFQFRQVVILEKREGARYRGGRISLSLRFSQLPPLRLTHNLGHHNLPIASFLRPLDINTHKLSAPRIPTPTPPNRCRKACCP